MDTLRLVPSPTFVLTCIRSGSTLLRCVLDSHSMIRAAHEFHLPDIRVQLSSRYVRLAMEVAGLTVTELEHLLWDQVLYQELRRSGKELIVEKTPGTLIGLERIEACWPDARYLILLRHPAQVLESALAQRPEWQPQDVVELVVEYLRLLADARTRVDGFEVRYEDLTHDPEVTMQGVCAYLGVPWEPSMLEYGRFDHGPFLDGIGDFSDRIRAGRPLPGRPLTRAADLAPELQAACAALGYD